MRLILVWIFVFLIANICKCIIYIGFVITHVITHKKSVIYWDTAKNNSIVPMECLVLIFFESLTKRKSLWDYKLHAEGMSIR